MSGSTKPKRKRTALAQLEAHLKGPKDELQGLLYPTEGSVDYDKLRCVLSCVRVWGSWARGRVLCCCGDTLRCARVCVAHPRIYLCTRQQAAQDGGGGGAGKAVQVPSHARDRGKFYCCLVALLVVLGPRVSILLLKIIILIIITLTPSILKTKTPPHTSKHKAVPGQEEADHEPGPESVGAAGAGRRGGGRGRRGGGGGERPAALNMRMGRWIGPLAHSPAHTPIY